jgi:F-type H+-transporting ATPase subunit epsilon
MAGTFKFELVSPERILVSTDVDEVLVPGTDGDFTVLAGHAPVISTLRPGVIETKPAGGGVTRIFIDGGFCEVTPTSLTVLAEKAHDIATMDKTTIMMQLAAAEAVLNSSDATDEQMHAAHTAISHLKWLDAHAA